eukprot:1216619-Amphidinium_carterae.1
MFLVLNFPASARSQWFLQPLRHNNPQPERPIGLRQSSRAQPWGYGIIAEVVLHAMSLLKDVTSRRLTFKPQS